MVPSQRDGAEFPSAEPASDLNSLDHYLEEISRFPLLDSDREAELGRRARAGDEDAVGELVQSNLRFVVSVAKRYQRSGVPLSDLIQEGNLGLVTAARRFDPDQGVKFISYAVWWIRQAMLVLLARQGRAVRVPMNRVTDLAKISRARARLEQELGREPSPAELAEETGIELSTLAGLLTVSTAALRLDQPIYDKQVETVMDRFVEETAIGSGEAVEAELFNSDLHRALDALQPREARVLRLFYGLEGREHTLEEIGQNMGICRERVRQIRDRGLLRLRQGPIGRDLLGVD